MSLGPPQHDCAVVITGASSGIGQQIARGLAERGYPLTLVARRRDRLDELAAELTDRHEVPVEVLALDLNDPAARAELIAELTTRPAAGLVNSAGFGTSGPFHTLPLDRERDQVMVNAVALMELTHAALPAMIERGTGAVLNIGSIAGFQPLPGAAVYSATKAFVQTFSEAVGEELHGTGVSCSVLCPGPVPTEWWEIAGADGPGDQGSSLTQTSVRDVADAGISAMLEGKRCVVPGLVPRVAGLAGRLAPRRLLLPALRVADARRRS